MFEEGEHDDPPVLLSPSHTLPIHSIDLVGIPDIEAFVEYFTKTLEIVGAPSKAPTILE